MGFLIKITNANSRMVRQTKRKSGGGWSQGPPLSPQASYISEYKYHDDCAASSRPGSIQSNPNPELAQTRMAGGSKKPKTMKRKTMARKTMARKTMARKTMARSNKKSNKKGTMKRTNGGFACGLKRGGSKRRGFACGDKRGGFACGDKRMSGGCGCAMKRGGSRIRNKRGGRYQIDTATSIGGDGPIVAPVYSHVPCEAARPMPLNPTMPTLLGDSPNPDVNVSGLRPAFIQAGGVLAYDAPRAGFSFVPNIAQGQPLNPGQIPYNEVISQTEGCSKTCGTAIANINKA